MVQWGTSKLYYFERTRAVSLGVASPPGHLDLAPRLISTVPRAGPLTEEEVPLLFSNTRQQQPPPLPQLRPVGKTTKLERAEPQGPRRSGANQDPHLRVPLPPRSPPPITPSRYRTEVLAPVPAGPLRSVNGFSIPRRVKSEGLRCAQEAVAGRQVPESRPRPDHAKDPIQTVPGPGGPSRPWLRTPASRSPSSCRWPPAPHESGSESRVPSPPGSRAAYLPASCPPRSPGPG